MDAAHLNLESRLGRICDHELWPLRPLGSSPLLIDGDGLREDGRLKL
jgi:hypothetical protein